MTNEQIQRGIYTIRRKLATYDSNKKHSFYACEIMLQVFEAMLEPEEKYTGRKMVDCSHKAVIQGGDTVLCQDCGITLLHAKDCPACKKSKDMADKFNDALKKPDPIVEVYEKYVKDGNPPYVGTKEWCEFYDGLLEAIKQYVEEK